MNRSGWIIAGSVSILLAYYEFHFSYANLMLAWAIYYAVVCGLLQSRLAELERRR